MRLKAVLSVFAFVVIMAAGGLIFFRNQLGVSADTTSTGKSVTVSVIVTDKSGRPIPDLPFTAIMVATNTSIGSGITNTDGQYNLSVPIKLLKSETQYNIKLTDPKGLYEPVLANFIYQSRIITYKLKYQVTLIQTFTITASGTTGGKIVPFGKIPVSRNGTLEFFMTPENGYKISDLKIAGKTVPVTSNYVFRGVNANSTIEVVFAPVSTVKDYNVSGRIVSAIGGKGVAGATVNIVKKIDNQILKSERTDNDGGFSVVLPEGLYAINVLSGTRKTSISLTVSSAISNTPIIIKLQ